MIQQIFIAQGLVVLILVTLLFIVANLRKDNSIIDILFGPLIFVTSITSLLYFDFKGVNIFFIIFLILFLAWTLRISSRIYLKNKGKAEDFRYKSFRDDWMRRGVGYFYFRSYLQIFLLQGFIVLLMAVTPTFIFFNSVNFSLISFIFLVLAFIGLFIETISDRQLDKFIKNKNKTEKIMKQGLWKYSRHPNYFGESLLWFGLGFAAFSLFLNSPQLLSIISSGAVFLFILFSFISPLLITSLLLFVSGVPMLERRWDEEGGPEWVEYKSKTSKFILWFTK